MVAFSAAGNANTGAVVAGPSGIVTNHGAIGPQELGLGLGHQGSDLGYNGYNGNNRYNNVGSSGVGAALGSYGAAGLANGNGLSRSGLGLGFGSGHNLGLGKEAGLGLGNGQGFAGLGHQGSAGLGHQGFGQGSYAAGGFGAGAGFNTVTPGGGRIQVGPSGAVVQGPSTVPVVIEGPSGKIIAKGLWGPTNNIGLAAAHGNAARGWST